MANDEKPEPLTKFLSDQAEAARVGRDIYTSERQSSALRFDALAFAFRRAELVVTSPTAEKLLEEARKYETYLQGGP